MLTVGGCGCGAVEMVGTMTFMVLLISSLGWKVGRPVDFA